VRVAGTQRVHRGAEVTAAVAGPVVSQHTLDADAGGGELGGSGLQRAGGAAAKWSEALVCQQRLWGLHLARLRRREAHAAGDVLEGADPLADGRMRVP
jgi:hypothetical protein